jgi:hypothetical protein
MYFRTLFTVQYRWPGTAGTSLVSGTPHAARVRDLRQQACQQVKADTTRARVDVEEQRSS